MAETLDRHLERMAARGAADRRNGGYTRGLLTELGLIALHVPRTRLHRIMNAKTLPAAWSAARRFADRWQRSVSRRSPACAPT